MRQLPSSPLLYLTFDRCKGIIILVPFRLSGGYLVMILSDYVESEVTVSGNSLGKLFKVRFRCRNVMINLDLDNS